MRHCCMAFSFRSSLTASTGHHSGRTKLGARSLYPETSLRARRASYRYHRHPRTLARIVPSTRDTAQRGYRARHDRRTEWRDKRGWHTCAEECRALHYKERRDCRPVREAESVVRNLVTSALESSSCWTVSRRWPEKDYLAQGTEDHQVFDTDYGRVGLLVCTTSLSCCRLSSQS